MTCREAGPLLHARLDNELDMADYQGQGEPASKSSYRFLFKSFVPCVRSMRVVPCGPCGPCGLLERVDVIGLRRARDGEMPLKSSWLAQMPAISGIPAGSPRLRFVVITQDGKGVRIRK
jgi:hypothetical protein